MKKTNKPSTRTENSSAINLNASVGRKQFVAAAGYHESLCAKKGIKNGYLGT